MAKHNIQMYCSKACKGAGWRVLNPERMQVLRQREKKRESKTKPTPVVLQNAHVKLYSKLASKIKAYQKLLSAHQRSAKSVGCIGCGAEFCPLYKSGNMKFCNPDCCSRHNKLYPTPNAIKGRRIQKAKRRAKERNADAAKIDPIDICKQGGWLCQLCGIATPQDKRGSIQPNAPEVDHIYPLAKGGKHVKANLQCLCRSCNAWKSDKIVSTEMALHYLNSITHSRGTLQVAEF